ncbi:MAG: alpha/beta fold hydrolase [Geminicoccaceae bacterium]
MSSYLPSSHLTSPSVHRRRAARIGRCGPRPLALHVAYAEWAWRSGNSQQLASFYQGVKAYRHHPYHRDALRRPTVWEEGNCRLIDYGPIDGWPLLVIPSLVNRAYILDLMPGASLLEFLRSCGVRPLLLDWGDGTGPDRQLSLNGLIQERMAPALSWIHYAIGKLPLVLGYCMGGTLATALACRHQDQMAGLALLATPWDFNHDHRSSDQFMSCCNELASGTSRIGGLPVDFLQTLFAQIDPLNVPRKFAHFARMNPTSDAAVRFVAIEDWLNDGVSLSPEVAAECLRDWYGYNVPARGAWQVGDFIVRPELLDLPVCLVIPDRDRIVPPDSALALGNLIRERELIRPKAGHVGMVVGQNAKATLWTPLLLWLRHIAAMQKKPWKN